MFEICETPANYINSKCAEIHCYGPIKFAIGCSHCELITNSFEHFQTHFRGEHLPKAEQLRTKSIKNEETSIILENIEDIEIKSCDEDIDANDDNGDEYLEEIVNSEEADDENSHLGEIQPIWIVDIDEDTTQTYFEIEYDKRQQEDDTNDSSSVNSCHVKATPSKERKRATKEDISAQRFKCQHCPKTFSLKTNRKVHELRHTDRREFACDMCSKAFYTRAELRNHKRYHLNDRSYVCEECGKRFHHSWVLRNHKRTHSVQPKTIPCPQCDKFFTTKDNLRSHTQIHNTLPNFICKTCNEAFTNRKKLYNHKQKRHKDELLTKPT